MLRKIYWEVGTGNVLVHVCFNDYFVETTLEQDFSFYAALKERVPESVKKMTLTNEYIQDFMDCTGFRIDPVTQNILFSYPDPNAPQEPPVYQVPLTEQVAELKAQNSEIILTLVMNDLM